MAVSLTLEDIAAIAILKSFYKSARLSIYHKIRDVPYDRALMNAIIFGSIDCKSRLLCNIAVKYNGEYIYCVAKRFITEEMFLNAISKPNNNCNIIDYMYKLMPEKVTTDTYLLALSKIKYRDYTSTILNIPKHLITEELCFAVIENGYNDTIKHLCNLVPHHMSMELCIAAVKKHPLSFPYITKYLPQYDTKELRDIAVKGNGNNLLHVPRYYITEEMCHIALINGGNYDVIIYIVRVLPHLISKKLRALMNEKS